MSETKTIRIVLYVGMSLFLISLLTSLLDVGSVTFYYILRTLLFLISFWFFLWHFKVTKGHRAAYDRISEGTILLMVIYNPLKPFILDVFVWNFLDVVFLWVFWLYLLEVSDIEQKIVGNVRNWSNTGEEIL